MKITQLILGSTIFSFAFFVAHTAQISKKKVEFENAKTGYTLDYTWEDDKLDSIRYIIFSGDEKRPVATTQLQYNDKGLLKARRSTTTDSTLISLHKFGYNEKDAKISESVFRNDSEIAYVDSLRYNDQGMLWLIDRFENGVMTSYRQINSREQGFKTEFLYEKKGEKFEPILYRLWRYHNGNIQSLELQRFAGGAMQRAWVQEYTYQDGRIKSIVRWWGEESSRYLVDSTVYSVGEGEAITESLYDSDGSLVQKTSITFDPASGTAKAGRLQPKVLFRNGLLSIVLPERGEAAVSVYKINGVLAHSLVLKGRASYSLDLTRYLAHGFYIGVVRAGNRQFKLKLPLFRR